MYWGLRAVHTEVCKDFPQSCKSVHPFCSLFRGSLPGLCGWLPHPGSPLDASLCLGCRLFRVKQKHQALAACRVRVVYLPVLCMFACNTWCGEHLCWAALDYVVPCRYPCCQVRWGLPSLWGQRGEIKSAMQRCFGGAVLAAPTRQAHWSFP